MLATLLGAVMLLHPQSHERILLVADTDHPTFERQAVFHTLARQLADDPHVTLLTPEPQAEKIEQAQMMRCDAIAALARARAHLERLDPFDAQREGSFAITRLRRVADLSGDLGRLPEAYGLTIAAMLHLGEQDRALHLARQLWTLDADWEPDGHLFSPTMKAQIRHARQQPPRKGSRRLRITTSEPSTAVFVDGTFINMGQADLSVSSDHEHHIFVQPESGDSAGHAVTLPSTSHVASLTHIVFNMPLRTTRSPLSQSYRAMVDATRNARGYVNTLDPVLTTRQITQVWVLTDEHGMLRLTSFDLTTGRREQLETPAALTHVTDIQGAAAHLYGHSLSGLQSLAHGHGSFFRLARPS